MSAVIPNQPIDRVRPALSPAKIELDSEWFCVTRNLGFEFDMKSSATALGGATFEHGGAVVRREWFARPQ